MNCPKCNVELVEKKRGKQRDGTGYIEFRCPRCKGRFADLRIPYSAFEFQEGG